MTLLDAAGTIHRTDYPAIRQYFLNSPFDAVEPEEALRLIARADARDRFRYVVTPNADHVVRLNRQPELRAAYDDAWLVLCDSKPISLFAHLRSRRFTHVTGSDLTVKLFRTVVTKGDRIAIIVANRKIGEDVQAAFPDVDIRIHVPPMGLLTNVEAQQQCVDFVIDACGRFTFLAVGAPQSEKIAHLLAHEPRATGIGLCIGASLEFLVGAKQRAPLWMQRLGLEWMHRMVSEPKRLWRRYLFGALPLLALFAKDIRQARMGGTLVGPSAGH